MQTVRVMHCVCFITHTCLSCNHEGGVAIVVLVVDVYVWTHVQLSDDVYVAFAHSQHEPVLNGGTRKK